jgi:hypothetical protein
MRELFGQGDAEQLKNRVRSAAAHALQTVDSVLPRKHGRVAMGRPTVPGCEE